MKKIVIVVVVLALLALVVCTGVAFWSWQEMQKPLYQPGMVRTGENLRAPLTPPAQPGDEHRWQVEPDVQLWHWSQGAPTGGGRNVLVVHGGPGIPYVEPWPGLGPLASDYRFHYYDQRGCGRSTRPLDRFTSSNYYENMTALDQALGLGAQVADIERIRRILGDDRLVLVGHSWGGFLASLYAAEFPERVEALILVAPANMLVMPQESGGLFAAVRQRLPASMHAEYDAYISEYLGFQDLFSRSEADLAALNQRFATYYQVAVAAPIPAQGEPGGWMVQAQYLSMGMQHDYRGALRHVTAPALVIHAADDLQTEVESRTYVDALPHARFQVVENAGHFPFYEQPAAFAAVVGDFLEELR